MPPREELEDRTVDELRDLASDAEVEGRSSMDKAELVDALADDTDTTADTSPDRPAPAPAVQTEQQEAVNERRTGLDPVLAEARDATREREAELARPSAVDEPVRVVGADTFAAAREATRQAEADAAASVRTAPATP